MKVYNGTKKEGWSAAVRNAGILILLLILFGTGISLTHAADTKNPIPTEQDVEYLLKSIDARKRTLEPGKPESEEQAILFEALKELKALDAKHNAEVAKYDPIEFSSFDELEQKDKISLLKSNLKGYWDCRKRYYDQKDAWLKKYRNQVGKAIQYKGRLEGTADYYFERMEGIYIRDLTAFYEFVLKYHSKMAFTKDGILMEDPRLVDQLNKLWGRAVKSANDLTKARETGAKIMLEGIEGA
jgi:hypothetical protein